MRKSRGWGKFRRNRQAMIALSVIAVYMALAGWVWAMEGVHALGRVTGGWSLSQSPVLGMLLPERTLERVGPRWLPGFGLEQDTARREDQADFLLKAADEAIKSAEAAEAKGLPASEALSGAGYAELRLADRPLGELRAVRDRALGLFGELDGLKRRKTAATKIVANADKAVLLASELTGVQEEDAERVRDDLAATIEEVMFSTEDFARLAPEGDPLKAIDTLPMQDAADGVRDGKAEPAAVTATIAEVRGLASVSLSSVDPELDVALDRIEPEIRTLFPRPEGFKGTLYAIRTVLGTDAQGRSILLRSLYSAKIAIQVGVVVALVSVLFGGLLGAAAAYYGGWIDHLVTWLYSTLSSLPQLVLLAVLAFMFLGTEYERTLVPVYAALCLTFWIGPCRVIRGEVLKVKQLEYAQAATVIGFARPYILLKHILPNTLHLMFINFSLLFIGAIKSEVILTFLGLGIKEGSSWGLMISQAAPEVITGIFWQIGAATAFMLVLVLAFNIVSDALQDAFDPKHVG